MRYLKKVKDEVEVKLIVQYKFQIFEGKHGHGYRRFAPEKKS
jgi:hypothetical protein